MLSITILGLLGLLGIGTCAAVSAVGLATYLFVKDRNKCREVATTLLDVLVE